MVSLADIPMEKKTLKDGNIWRCYLLLPARYADATVASHQHMTKKGNVTMNMNVSSMQS